MGNNLKFYVDFDLGLHELDAELKMEHRFFFMGSLPYILSRVRFITFEYLFFFLQVVSIGKLNSRYPIKRRNEEFLVSIRIE